MLRLFCLLAICAFCPGLIFAAPEGDGDAASEFRIYYDRGFVIASEDGKNRIQLGGYLQTRLSFDDDTKVSFPSFQIPRGRFNISGNLFRPEIAYRFETEFAPEKLELRDYYVDFSVVSRYFQIRVGRFKTLFSRQAIASASAIEFVDRSIVIKAFGTGREIGVLFHNGRQQPFEWAAGIFNGGLFGRAGFNFFGPSQSAEGYSEGDFTGGPIRASVALSVLRNARPNREIPFGIGGGIDGDIKVEGFATTFGWYLGAGDIDQSEAGKTGGYAQASYMIAGRFQPSFRYAIVDNAGPRPNRETQHEILGGLSIYFYRHSLKLQADGGVITTREYGPEGAWIIRGQTTRLIQAPQIRLQMQFAF